MIENKDLIEWRLEKANITFDEGRLAFRNKYNEGAVNRFYYAAFHAVRALLATRNLDSAKHKGVIPFFDREFVKPGLISKQSSKTVRRLFNMRTEADYRDFVMFSDEQVQEALGMVKALIAEITAYLEREYQL